jgi:hypothetical protein
MAKSDLPVYIVKIHYKGRSLEEARKKKQDPQLTGCTRYLYIYAHESLDERMMKAWREDATAEIFKTGPTLDDCVKASPTKGVWE